MSANTAGKWDIRRDFNDRIHAGSVDDLAGYESYLSSIHHNLPLYANDQLPHLKTAETKYFYSLA